MCWTTRFQTLFIVEITQLWIRAGGSTVYSNTCHCLVLHVCPSQLRVPSSTVPSNSASLKTTQRHSTAESAVRRWRFFCVRSRCCNDALVYDIIGVDRKGCALKPVQTLWELFYCIIIKLKHNHWITCCFLLYAAFQECCCLYLVSYIFIIKNNIITYKVCKTRICLKKTYVQA